ncbi:Ig-like domain-containing protein, partial [Enterococcus faecalis]|uniref:Ig-like domain-containing protein n=1 Tax=Enterococcus faecalis TaxID=1351 RepID=UPI003D6BE66E
ENTSDKSVTYTSLVPSIATVDQSGKVTGVKAGTASINVRSTVNTAISTTVDVVVKEA